MGGGIGQVLAVAGYEVWIRDLTPEILEHTREVIVDTRFGLRRAVERGKLPEDQLETVISRLSFTTEVSDMKAADFVIEAVPEALDLKQRVFAELDQTIKP